MVPDLKCPKCGNADPDKISTEAKQRTFGRPNMQGGTVELLGFKCRVCGQMMDALGKAKLH